mmetsp:Transcript_17727/g.53356  ORF Transcript_17727/g.53356 Transcript_17727/m.53356 type:complete len:226 (-) Transcript_17727:92-769(-)
MGVGGHDQAAKAGPEEVAGHRDASPQDAHLPDAPHGPAWDLPGHGYLHARQRRHDVQQRALRAHACRDGLHLHLPRQSRRQRLEKQERRWLHRPKGQDTVLGRPRYLHLGRSRRERVQHRRQQRHQQPGPVEEPVRQRLPPAPGRIALGSRPPAAAHHDPRRLHDGPVRGRHGRGALRRSGVRRAHQRAHHLRVQRGVLLLHAGGGAREVRRLPLGAHPEHHRRS